MCACTIPKISKTENSGKLVTNKHDRFYLNQRSEMETKALFLSTPLQLKEVQESLSAEKLKSCEVSERFSAMESSRNEREGGLLEQCQRLEERVEDMTRQNSLLHEEADKVCGGERCREERGGEMGGEVWEGCDAERVLYQIHVFSLSPPSLLSHSPLSPPSFPPLSSLTPPSHPPPSLLPLFLLHSCQPGY